MPKLMQQNAKDLMTYISRDDLALPSLQSDRRQSRAQSRDNLNNYKPRAMTYIRRLLVMMVVVFGMISNTYAQPSIDSASGTVTNRGTVSIVGSGFGIKSTANPLKYDLFEQTGSGYTAGEILSNDWNLCSDYTSCTEPVYNSPMT